ncbi:hypothetical protein BDV11DRAFT_172703 [Aspergillus similis]
MDGHRTRRGGLTAWRTAEREAKADPRKTNIGNFVNITTAGVRAGALAGGFTGAIAISLAIEPMSLVPPAIEKGHGGPLQMFIPSMLRSIARLFPSLDPSQYMTRELIGRIDLSTPACPHQDEQPSTRYYAAYFGNPSDARYRASISV